MSSAKSKNLIIYILLILNFFLLILVVMDKVQEQDSSQAEGNALRHVLMERGISVDDNVDFSIYAPPSCVMLRDSASELELITGMIGKCIISDLGGNIYFYESDSGQAVFRGSGEMDVLFSSNNSVDIYDGKSIAKYMEKHGLEMASESATLIEGNESYDLVMCCALDGYCVYNAKLTFTMGGDGVSMINGTRIFVGRTVTNEDKPMDCVSAVMRFLEIVKDEGYICSSIKNVESGYIMDVSISGECVLKPVWRILTDTGELFINAVSGKLETITA